jgi:hypothetical protein
MLYVTGSSTSIIGATAGGVIGGLLFIAVLVGGYLYMSSKRPKYTPRSSVAAGDGHL